MIPVVKSAEMGPILKVGKLQTVCMDDFRKE